MKPSMNLKNPIDFFTTIPQESNRVPEFLTRAS